MLAANIHKSIIFNKNIDNPSFLMEYAMKILENHSFENKETEYDEELLSKMLFFPKYLKESIHSLDPHKLFVYAHDFCSTLHRISQETPINKQLFKNLQEIIGFFSKVFLK
jgi:arginyl-tRNA synthetase